MERILDVSTLEAPEPLVRALAALDTLPHGDYLRFQHRMMPCQLYGVLEKRGFAQQTFHGESVECEVFIWHEGDTEAEAAAKAAAATLTPWQD